MNFSKPKPIELPSFVDHRGMLLVGQWPDQIPFEVKRFFVISNVPAGEPRGIHAHKECHQLLVCLKGSLKAMVDNGDERKVINLTDNGESLHMPPATWGAQYDYSADAVLLVLASHAYDPDDYIHDYEEFLSFVGH